MNNHVQMNDALEKQLQAVYENINLENLESAKKILDEALSIDFDNPEVVALLKCTSFWLRSSSVINKLDDNLMIAEYYMKEWNSFQDFTAGISGCPIQCIHSFQQMVFRKAQHLFEKVNEHAGGHDFDLLVKIGRCLKKREMYDKALAFFEKANQVKRDNASVLSELGDCYAFLNEIRAAKVFFREAFFINPSEIDLNSLESFLIRKVIDGVSNAGYKRVEEWIPVFGVLYGVFNIKRELKPVEFGKLKQEIMYLENKRIDDSNRDVIIPRLLTRYFWLIDHYLTVKESKSKIDEILSKIKNVNPAIYDIYIN